MRASDAPSKVSRQWQPLPAAPNDAAPTLRGQGSGPHAKRFRPSAAHPWDRSASAAPGLVALCLVRASFRALVPVMSARRDRQGPLRRPALVPCPTHVVAPAHLCRRAANAHSSQQLGKPVTR